MVVSYLSSRWLCNCPMNSLLTEFQAHHPRIKSRQGNVAFCEFTSVHITAVHICFNIIITPISLSTNVVCVCHLSFVLLRAPFQSLLLWSSAIQHPDLLQLKLVVMQPARALKSLAKNRMAPSHANTLFSMNSSISRHIRLGWDALQVQIYS